MPDRESAIGLVEYGALSIVILALRGAYSPHPVLAKPLGPGPAPAGNTEASLRKDGLSAYAARPEAARPKHKARRAELALTCLLAST